MPSHLSGEPDVETNGEVLCPRNLIRALEGILLARRSFQTMW
jgi:hypothetical protein